MTMRRLRCAAGRQLPGPNFPSRRARRSEPPSPPPSAVRALGRGRRRGAATGRTGNLCTWQCPRPPPPDPPPPSPALREAARDSDGAPGPEPRFAGGASPVRRAALWLGPGPRGRPGPGEPPARLPVARAARARSEPERGRGLGVGSAAPAPAAQPAPRRIATQASSPVTPSASSPAAARRRRPVGPGGGVKPGGSTGPRGSAGEHRGRRGLGVHWVVDLESTTQSNWSRPPRVVDLESTTWSRPPSRPGVDHPGSTT